MGRPAASVAVSWLAMALCVLPTAAFLFTLQWHVLATEFGSAWSPGGMPSVIRTVELALSAAAIGGLFGWLTGLWLNLSKPTARSAAYVLLAIPLVCPPFLWAVGVQSWKRFLPFEHQFWLDGFSGHVIASSLVTAPIVALLCATGGNAYTQSAMESALMHGGKVKLAIVLLRSSLPLAISGSLVAGFFVAADVGTGQMMGWQTGAGVIHAALVTGQNFDQAASRSLLMLSMVVPLVTLAAWPLSQRVIYHSPPPRTKGQMSFHGMSVVALAAIPLFGGMGAMLCTVFLSGIRPLWRDAWLTWSESAAATFEMAGISALVTAVMATFLGVCLVNHPRLWRVCLIVGFVLLSVPQSIHGLGWILLRTKLLNLSAFVGEPAIIVSLRWCLAAAHFVALAWSRMQTTALDATRLLCPSRSLRWWTITKPLVTNAIVPVAMITGLIVTGDAAATVLLQPPGWAPYSVRLFGIMDNAPEAHVAMFCLIYLGGVAVAFTGGTAVSYLLRRSSP